MNGKSSLETESERERERELRVAKNFVGEIMERK